MFQRRRGLDELDLLGENALRAQLPEHKEAGFIARKQDKLPLKELMRQSSSMSQFDSQEQQTPPPYPTTPTNQTKPESYQTCSSLETNQTKPKIEKPVPQTLLTNILDPAPKSEVKVTEVKLQNIKLRMEDVVPHPTLPPLDLQAEGPVSLVLHYSCTVPAPGVSVHVVQFTNTGKLPVSFYMFSNEYSLKQILHGLKRIKIINTVKTLFSKLNVLQKSVIPYSFLVHV